MDHRLAIPPDAISAEVGDLQELLTGKDVEARRLLLKKVVVRVEHIGNEGE